MKEIILETLRNPEQTTASHDLLSGIGSTVINGVTIEMPFVIEARLPRGYGFPKPEPQEPQPNTEARKPRPNYFTELPIPQRPKSEGGNN